MKGVGQLASETTIIVPSNGAAQPYVIHLLPPSHEWTDPGLYAPAIPGVIVALLGLWIAHWLTTRRDRRKEVLELCENVKAAALEAENACAAAWLSEIGPDRAKFVHDAKSKLQNLGIMATDLNRRTSRGLLAAILCSVFDRVMGINVINEMARFRDIATSDPFEEPTRPPNNSDKINDIRAAVTEILARVNLQFHDLYD